MQVEQIDRVGWWASLIAGVVLCAFGHPVAGAALIAVWLIGAYGDY